MNLPISCFALAAAIAPIAFSSTSFARPSDCDGCEASVGDPDVGYPPPWTGASAPPEIQISAIVLPGTCDPNDYDTRKGCAASITRSWSGDFSFPGPGLGSFSAEVDIRGNTYEYQNTPPVTNSGGSFTIDWPEHALTCGWDAVWRFEHSRDLGPVSPPTTTVSTTGSCSLCEMP